jgi:hypothetical protein
MQFTGSCRVVNGSAYVEFVVELQLGSVVGTFTVGETCTFASGAEAVLLDDGDAPIYRFAVTSVQQPVALDTLEGDTSSATAEVNALETAPSLSAAGVDVGSFFIREGDQIGYAIAGVASESRIQLAAPYGGVSSDAADGLIHSSRTANFALPSFDRRDRQLQVLLNELVSLLDAALQDHEDRIAALE